MPPARNQSVSAFAPTKLATSVLDTDTGLSLDYKQLRTHPKLGHIWSKSYASELGRLCQALAPMTPAPINASKAPTPSTSLTTMTSPPTDAPKSPTPRSSAKSVQKNQTQTVPVSPSTATASATREMSEQEQPPWN
eukprot:CCRYP_013039-RB/>CCRYP_013039-RB protein AED:0.49 eAED:0.47 QI:0/0/0/0.5/0/0/2/0/135